MNRQLAILAIVILSAAAIADTDPVKELKKGQPKAVADLIDRIVGCNHWHGESPYDAERTKEIEKAIAELRCADLAKDETALKKQYGGKPKVAKAIDAAKELTY